MDKRLLVITTGEAITGNLPTFPKASLTSEGRFWRINPSLDTIAAENGDRSDITPAHWSSIIRVIADHYDSHDGFIVTHDPKTMGYTCAALSFALENLGKPIIITGSQIPYNRHDTDMKINLENAVRVAITPDYGGVRGVVGLFGSHIISGTRVVNPSSFHYDAFDPSPEGSLGRIGRTIKLDPTNLERYHAYLRREENPAALTRADLVVKDEFDSRLVSLSELPGMDPENFTKILRGLVESDGTLIKGMIFQAFGSGDISAHLRPCFEYLKENEIPVVVTTQLGTGSSDLRDNEPGLELARRKLAIPAHDMSVEVIATKMMWLLGQGISYPDFEARMLEDVRGEISVPKVVPEPGAAPQAWRRPGGVPDRPRRIPARDDHEELSASTHQVRLVENPSRS